MMCDTVYEIVCGRRFMPVVTSHKGKSAAAHFLFLFLCIVVAIFYRGNNSCFIVVQASYSQTNFITSCCVLFEVRCLTLR